MVVVEVMMIRGEGGLQENAWHGRKVSVQVETSLVCVVAHVW